MGDTREPAHPWICSHRMPVPNRGTCECGHPSNDHVRVGNKIGCDRCNADAALLEKAKADPAWMKSASAQAVMRNVSRPECGTHGPMVWMCKDCREYERECAARDANEAIEVTHDLAVKLSRAREALRAIGNNTCGVEPLAAAFARAIFEETSDGAGCKRCGKPVAYPGAVYCGAACSAQAEVSK